MTVEEIKAAYSMSDIVERYGLQPTRAGFIPCPFHQGDRQPSLKVYDRDFYCHACGVHGDIFDFVMLMDDVDFKTAFQSLGGAYEKPSFASYLKNEKRKRQHERKKIALELKIEEKRYICMLVEAYRGIIQNEEPFTDLWCHCMNGLQYQLYLLESLEMG